MKQRRKKPYKKGVAIHLASSLALLPRGTHLFSNSMAAHTYRFEVDPLLFAVQKFAPSKTIPTGPAAVGNVPSNTPSQSRSLVMSLLPRLVTQRLVPSKAMNCGLDPTANVPVIFPSEGRRRLTVLLPELATQMDVPSKVTPTGFTPTGKVPSNAPSLARNFVTVLALP